METPAIADLFAQVLDEQVVQPGLEGLFVKGIRDDKVGFHGKPGPEHPAFPGATTIGGRWRCGDHLKIESRVAWRVLQDSRDGVAPFEVPVNNLHGLPQRILIPEQARSSPFREQ